MSNPEPEFLDEDTKIPDPNEPTDDELLAEIKREERELEAKIAQEEKIAAAAAAANAGVGTGPGGHAQQQQHGFQMGSGVTAFQERVITTGL